MNLNSGGSRKTWKPFVWQSWRGLPQEKKESAFAIAQSLPLGICRASAARDGDDWPMKIANMWFDGRKALVATVSALVAFGAASGECAFPQDPNEGFWGQAPVGGIVLVWNVAVLTGYGFLKDFVYPCLGRSMAI